MSGSADVVITGARVWTGDPASPWSDSIAVRGDRIVALGADASGELVGPRTRRIHRPDALVVPGFQDAHVHAPFAGRNRLHVWLNDLVGRHAYLDRIAEYAAANPDLPWIIGGGWAMEHFPGGTPSKGDLDAIVPDRPVFLMNRDVHGAWVNSRALEVAGIGPDTPDPADGRIERDPSTGEATGTLHEGAAYSFQDRHVPAPSREDWEAAILESQGHLHALGITGWQDAWVTPATLEAYRSLAQTRPAHRTRRRRAVVGTAPRAGPGQRVPHPARGRPGRELPPDEREDHDRRGAGELHRRPARALLRRLRWPHRQPRPVLRRARPPGRGGHRAGPARVPGPPARHRGPRRAQRPGRHRRRP